MMDFMRPKNKRTDAQCEIDFWSRVEINSKNECWPWTKGRSLGYGVVWMQGIKWRAHRYSLKLKTGNIPENLYACHSCDNPICCNPNHLFWGTPKENNQDCRLKGRDFKEKGINRYNSVLNDSMVREIRSSYIKRLTPMKSMAIKFGVSRSMIFAIIKRHKWKHIE